MASARWTKLVGDVRAERGRLALMVAAIAVSLAGVGAVLGAYAVLSREIAINYLGTRPAAATLELADGANPGLVEAVRRLPGVADAEAREVTVARARVGGDWRRMLLFVVDDFADLRLNRFRLERGAWPPPEGTMLVERSAISILESGVGGTVVVKTPHGAPTEVAITGIVHDPGLAPAWQERSGYGYITRATLARLGEAPVLGELRIALAGEPGSTRDIEARAADVARRLGDGGHRVSELRVPPPNQHPHQRQMVTLLVMMLAFAGMALVLSAVLVASSLAALLARQVREIGVMKTLGATRRQIAGLYATLVGSVGAVAALVAAPLGALGAHALAGAVSRLLNLSLTSEAIPAWVFAIQIAAGVALPLAVSAIPIRRASRRSIREAMDDHGVSPQAPGGGSSSLPLPLRNALRRPARLALTLGLLAAGGAMAVTAFQVKRGWEANVAKVYATRSYDVEVVLAAPAPRALVERVQRVPGVRAVEAWGYARAAFTRPGAIDVARTYPDRGHGSFVAMGLPPETTLIRFPLRAGRWLEAEDRDTDAVVLNHAAFAQAPGLRIGDEVRLSISGRPTTWRLAGVVEEIGAAGVAYVADAALARAVDTAGQVRLVRVATTARSADERTGIMRDVEATLDRQGASVESVSPLAELRTAMGDHVLVLVRLLLAMAAILGVVGVLGLVSAMGVSVVERTRELAIMKTLGATPGRIGRMLLAEGLSIAGLSYVVGWALSVPLTIMVDRIVGTLGFLAPLPLVLSPEAAAVWVVVGTAATLAATLVPARKASALVIRDALGRT
jgi:putative ABC transport system permease protein